MKSWSSKVSTGLILLTAAGALNSCRLFGGGEYANQTEVETDVPESLEQGKPSQGPAGTYATTNGVPPTSNLVDVPDPWQPSSQVPPLPVASAGGSNLAGLPAEGSRDLIDIPKPDFGNVSVHNTRPPAEMLSLGPPVTPASTRMSMASAPGTMLAPKVVRETVEPLAPAVPGEVEVAGAPKALAGSAEPGVPLLHSTARLSDFYKGLHGELLDGAVVSNDVVDDNAVPPPPPDEALSVPPPPPPEGQ